MQYMHSTLIKTMYRTHQGDLNDSINLPGTLGTMNQIRKRFNLNYLILRTSTAHSQFLKNVILRFNSSVLLNQLGNIFLYGPVARAIRRINSSDIDLPGRLMLEL